MIKYVVAYLSTVAIFLCLDALWLGLIARDFYKEQLGDLMATDVNFKIAAVFYAVYVVGIVIFAIAPALSKESLTHALLYGALFGFFAYGTYDFTNMATIQNWPFKMSYVDIIWGICITGFSSVAGYFITKLWF